MPEKGRPRRYFSKYTFHKNYGTVKSVRLQPTEEKLLAECFHMLGVEGKSFNQKMQNFIKLAHEKIKRLVALEEENKNLKAKIEKLESQLLKQRVMEVEEKEETTPKTKPNDCKITKEEKRVCFPWKLSRATTTLVFLLCRIFCL